VTFLREAYSLFPPAVRARFDIVSFDPRGIGQSTVLKCFASNKQEQQRAWDDTWARFDRACAAHAGPLLAHDSTADSARDMNLLRRAVGDPTLNYLGISYGTYLGATYANLFPAKVRAMVLDGNADPVQWATGTGGSSAVLSTSLRLRSDEGSAAALHARSWICAAAPRPVPARSPPAARPPPAPGSAPC
jgi:pimeloyl-ACP methyl ester carboxylesterase